MTFPNDQLRYCGATIVNFRGQLGWGTNTSSLSITLVEDENSGDNFIAPNVGIPSYFDYNGWSFGGIINSWNRRRGQSGFLYDVILEDPRQVTMGVQCILNNYNGPTYGISNLYNVYGYAEQTYGFGAANVDSTGFPAASAIQYIQTLINTTPISFRGYSYYVNLQNLLNIIPANFRISSDHISLFDIISIIAETVVCDFFLRLEYINGRHYIIPYFVSRANPPASGAINNFINTTESTYGNVDNTLGYELINDTTSKFLVGGKIQELYFQFQNVSDNILTAQELSKSELDEAYAKTQARTANIWPFWGYDARGNLIIGHGPPSARWSKYTYTDVNDVVREEWERPRWSSLGYHRFTIDGRPLCQIYANNGVPDGQFVDYPTDDGEMRFALAGFDEWYAYILYTSYMQSHPNFDPYNIGNNISSKAVMLGFPANLGNTRLAIDNLFLATGNFDGVIQCMGNWLGNLKEKGSELKSWFEGSLRNFISHGFKTVEPTIFDRLMAVYNYIRQYAETYYGKKYMVRIPSVLVKRNTETNHLEYSLKGISSAYFGESYSNVIYSSGLIPADITKIETDEGKFKSFVRFDLGISKYTGYPDNSQAFQVDENTNQILLDNDVQFYATNLDVEKIDAEHVTYSWWRNQSGNEGKMWAYITCDVDEDPIFLDNAELTDPRIVITLPERVTVYREYRANPFDDLFTNVVAEAWFDINGVYPTDGQYLQMRKVIAAQSYFGYETREIQEETSAVVMPTMVAVGLESQTLRYGPWYAQGLPGKTEFIKDDELVPWNYGGFTQLNLVANSMIIDGMSNRQDIEKGSIEFPGAPTYLLGDAMVSEGPVISDIQVNIDPQGGVTTTYNLSSWTPRFGELNNFYVKKFTNMSKQIQENNRVMRQSYKNPVGSRSNVEQTAGTRYRAPTVRRGKRNTSVSTVIGGDLIYETDVSGNKTKVRTNIGVLPDYYVETQLINDYESKAAASLDSIFRSFITQTNVSPSSLPHFETPSGGATTPTVNDLNPFGRYHDISLITQDRVITDDLINSGESLILNKRLFDNTQYAPTGVKAIALRGPLVVTGWGYNTDGNPVPAKSGNQFIDNVQERVSEWKTGPVDLRWDESRKVWAAGGTSTGSQEIYLGQLSSNIYAGQSGYVQLYNTNVTPPTLGSTSVLAWEWLFHGNTNLQLYTGERVVLAKIDGNYFIINAGNAACLE